MTKETFREMPCRRAGASGLWLSEIGLGLGFWGFPETGDKSRVGREDGYAILDRALELGVFHWDTANGYSHGNSERLVGDYFASRGKTTRDQVVIATKIAGFVSEPGTTAAPTPNQSGGSRLYIRAAVDDCLTRLRTDRLDLVVFHNPNVDRDGDYRAPLDEIWSAIDDLITAGKICYAGVSNYSALQIRHASDALANVAKDSSRRITTVQNCYNMLHRAEVARDLSHRERGGSEAGFLDECRRLGVGLIPYWPLASGALSGRYRRDTLGDASGLVLDVGRRDELLNDRNLSVLDDLVAFAKRRNITMPQLAIGWLLSKQEVVSVICGVSKVSQLEDNVKAKDVVLSANEVAELDAIVARALTVDEFIAMREQGAFASN